MSASWPASDRSYVKRSLGSCAQVPGYQVMETGLPLPRHRKITTLKVPWRPASQRGCSARAAGQIRMICTRPRHRQPKIDRPESAGRRGPERWAVYFPVTLRHVRI
jgi:hypothetical protein